MKRKSLLFILLMALFAPLAMNAQSRSTLTVYGDNTTTNEYVPIYGYWADSKSKCEFIIPKEKLSAMTGGRISAMKFYLSSSGNSNQISATFNVFVKEVSATTLTGFTGTDNATTVFSNTITIAANASNVEFDIPFSSPYVYNGGNLLVGFYQTGNTSYNHTYWTGETQSTNTAWSGYGSGSGSAQQFLPKTTFTYEISTTPEINLPATATVMTGFTTTLTASTFNVTGTPNITYASSNQSIATVTGSGTTATVTGVSAGTATITATMIYNSNTYTSTCDITVEDPSYCTPGTGNYDNDGIYNVTFGTNGMVVNNTVSGINYGDYSNLVGAVETETNGFEVAITYKTSYTYGTIIWVDWDDSYSFEGTEVVYAGQSGSDNPTTLTATFDVPATAPVGNHRMRIIGADMALDSYTGSLSAAANADPCGSYNYSTCHDYTLRVETGNPCGAPTNLIASNATANTIDLTWSGTNDSYEVRYIETLPTADFEDGFGAWTTIDADGDGFTWLWSGTITGVSGNNGSNYAAYSQSYDNDGGEVLYPDNYLVSPKVQLGGTITFYACAQDADWAEEHFGVAVSTTNNTNASAFTTIVEWTMTSSGSPAKVQGSWGKFTVDLSAYSGEGYVAIRHFNCSDNFYLDIDDITITPPDSAPWHTKNNITTTGTTLQNLDGNTTYAIQVRGYCQGEPNPSYWSAAITETTINGNVFITTGNWNVASNWQGNAVPAAGSDVIIAADVTVPAQYVADAGKITFENSATITVADGGQLKTTYGGVNATMEKTINGYGSANTNTTLGYYLLANPIKTDQNPATLGMTTGTYDLYYFDLNCDGTYDDYGNVDEPGEDGLEWRNYKEASFNLINGQGYLYASENTLPLSITGEIYPTNTNVKVTMHYSEDATLSGMNLLGNPFSCNAYLADGRSFYVMDPVAGDLVSGSGAIAPMQGIFVETNAVGNLNFTTTAPANNGKSALNINVTRQNALIDRAVINFGDGEGLRKFQLNPNHTKVYMPVEGNDYAVVYTENEGEMPVSFKAEKNGTYTLSFTTEDVELGYLHLIDNMTGNDVDLLSTPSYTFEASTTDYAQRFRLVFAAGNNDDNFAFFSNGSFVITNEGMATLQVVDVMGRIISSETINGNANVNVNAAPGVYMLRLVNGDNVKVQKVVVR